MILTESSAARVGSSAVSAIISLAGGVHQFLCYGLTTISTAISGAVGLVKNGAGTLTLTAGCTYTGETRVNQGAIVFSGPSVLNGVISGAGSLTKTSFTNLTIGGSNAYSGGTLSAPSSATGTITISQNNAFGTGLFTSAGASQIITGNSVTLSNNFQINTGNSLQFRVSAGGRILTITGDIAGGGSLSKAANGQVNLNGNLTYTGLTTITAGVLQTSKTVGASSATAVFTTGTNLTIYFNVPPDAGTQAYRFFQGSTNRTYTSVTLVNAPGRTATYNSTNSTLTVT